MIVDNDKWQVVSDGCFFCLLLPVTLLVWVMQYSLLDSSKFIILPIKGVQALDG